MRLVSGDTYVAAAPVRSSWLVGQARKRKTKQIKRRSLIRQQSSDAAPSAVFKSCCEETKMQICVFFWGGGKWGGRQNLFPAAPAAGGAQHLVRRSNYQPSAGLKPLPLQHLHPQPSKQSSGITQCDSARAALPDWDKTECINRRRRKKKDE